MQLSVTKPRADNSVTENEWQEWFMMQLLLLLWTLLTTDQCMKQIRPCECFIMYSYGLKTYNGENRLSGPGTDAVDEPGMMQGGGRWPYRYVQLQQYVRSLHIDL